MSLGKILAISTPLLCVVMAIAILLKEDEENLPATTLDKPFLVPIEVELDQGGKSVASVPAAITPPPAPVPSTPEPVVSPPEQIVVDRVQELFNVKGPKLPIVQTITYKSRVGWQKGRPAWLSDYASHYETSRHFIARSLNGKADYLKQDIAEGDQFNVLRQDIPIEFLLVIDISRCKMWFYYVDKSTGEKGLLKTYRVSLGRPDPSMVSGLLTPLGKYLLGSRIAIYKPNVMGHHKGQKVEMIRIFGSRWIPFEKEIGPCTAPSKGLGIHGVPWVKNSNGELVEDLSSLGKYESDGCIRMASEDVNEVFAIIITKPTVVELVKDYSQSEVHQK